VIVAVQMDAVHLDERQSRSGIGGDEGNLNPRSAMNARVRISPPTAAGSWAALRFSSPLGSCLWFTRKRRVADCGRCWVLSALAVVVAALRLLGGSWKVIFMLIAPRLILFAGPFLYLTFQIIKLSDFLSNWPMRYPGLP